MGTFHRDDCDLSSCGVRAIHFVEFGNQMAGASRASQRIKRQVEVKQVIQWWLTVQKEFVRKFGLVCWRRKQVELGFTHSPSRALSEKEEKIIKPAKSLEPFVTLKSQRLRRLEQHSSSSPFAFPSVWRSFERGVKRIVPLTTPVPFQIPIFTAPCFLESYYRAAEFSCHRQLPRHSHSGSLQKIGFNDQQTSLPSYSLLSFTIANEHLTSFVDLQSATRWKSKIYISRHIVMKNIE